MRARSGSGIRAREQRQGVRDAALARDVPLDAIAAPRAYSRPVPNLARLKDIVVEFEGRDLWLSLYRAQRQLGASHWTAVCQANVGSFRKWWADVTGDGPDILVNPF